MSKGASILETLAVLAITTTLVGSIAAGAGTTRQTLLLRFESDRLRMFLERAYTLALTSDHTTLVVVENGAVSLLEGDEISSSYQVTHGISLELPPHLEGQLHFYPTHTASPATVELRISQQTCTVTISLRGRIRTTC